MSSQPGGGASIFPVLGGGFVLFLILCVGAYFAFGPGDEKSAGGSAAVKYPGDPVKGEPVKTTSGLTYYDLKVGDGEQPSGPDTKVSVHYTGWLTNGTKFDSSVDRGQPSEFALNGVIPAWTEGVGSMKVGGKRKLIAPPELAYGQQARPKIPPGSTLIFDVELLGIVK